jgi:hypothetical protein
VQRVPNNPDYVHPATARRVWHMSSYPAMCEYLPSADAHTPPALTLLLLLFALRCPSLLLSAPCVTELSIRDNLLFQGLPQHALGAIIDSMQPRTVAPAKEIIKQVGSARGQCSWHHSLLAALAVFPQFGFLLPTVPSWVLFSTAHCCAC